jgi:hypothetical protein
MFPSKLRSCQGHAYRRRATLASPEQELAVDNDNQERMVRGKVPIAGEASDYAWECYLCK